LRLKLVELRAAPCTVLDHAFMLSTPARISRRSFIAPGDIDCIALARAGELGWRSTLKRSLGAPVSEAIRESSGGLHPELEARPRPASVPTFTHPYPTARGASQ